MKIKYLLIGWVTGLILSLLGYYLIINYQKKKFLIHMDEVSKKHMEIIRKRKRKYDMFRDCLGCRKKSLTKKRHGKRNTRMSGMR